MEPVTGNSGKSTSTEAREARSNAAALRCLVDLKPVALQVPDEFEHKLGCLCITELIAFYPNYNDTKMVYDNGVWEDDIDDEVWTTWVSRPGIAEKLVNVLHSGNLPEPNALILNVKTRCLYEAGEVLVRDFLYQHCAHSRGVHLH